jgi:hypothetical protein
MEAIARRQTATQRVKPLELLCNVDRNDMSRHLPSGQGMSHGTLPEVWTLTAPQRIA